MSAWLILTVTIVLTIGLRPVAPVPPYAEHFATFLILGIAFAVGRPRFYLVAAASRGSNSFSSSLPAGMLDLAISSSTKLESMPALRLLTRSKERRTPALPVRVNARRQA